MERTVQSKLNKIRQLYTVPLYSIELCNTILFHREARDQSILLLFSLWSFLRKWNFMKFNLFAHMREKFVR